jgi:hypothetical protein
MGGRSRFEHAVRAATIHRKKLGVVVDRDGNAREAAGVAARGKHREAGEYRSRGVGWRGRTSAPATGAPSRTTPTTTASSKACAVAVTRLRMTVRATTPSPSTEFEQESPRNIRGDRQSLGLRSEGRFEENRTAGVAAKADEARAVEGRRHGKRVDVGDADRRCASSAP